MTIKLPATLIAAALFEAYEEGDKISGASARETLQSRIADLACGRPVPLFVNVDPDVIDVQNVIALELLQARVRAPKLDITPDGLEALRRGYRAACAKITDATNHIRAIRNGPQDPRVIHDRLRELELLLLATCAGERQPAT